MPESQERRGADRISIVGRLSARARGTQEVWLVDLSATGARIMLGELLPDGSSCTLELPAALGSLTLSARVAWSSILGGEQTPEGERHLIYQSGLTFMDTSPDQMAALASILKRLTRKDVSRQRPD